jgi:TRAP transporter 4TM/12TM fusion protein
LIWAGGILLDVGIALFTEQVISAILANALAIIYLNVSLDGGSRGHLPWYDGIFAALGFGTGWYLFFRYPVLAEEFFYMPVETTIIGAILVLLVTEALRRTAGWGLFFVLMAFFVYGLLGHIVPAPLAGRSLQPSDFFAFLGIDNVAMLGIPLTIISTIVIIFIFFGQVLQQTGGSAFFTDIAAALMGRSRGGSAKIAVVASGLFGSISGSAVSNVASTGVITIPLMRQGGYRAPVAGAIEAVASTGGQIMPPIMGAAAFLMAELLEVGYQEVVLAAILPAILYYVAVFLQADLEAGRMGIAPIPKDQIPPALDVLKRGWHFIVPFAVLLIALFKMNAPPEKAALYGSASIVLLGLVLRYKGKKLTLSGILHCFIATGTKSVDIVIIGAAAGMILGVIDATGLSFGLTLILVQLGEGSLFILLLLTAIICIILGMGMPTTALYFLLATLAAPPLIKLGVQPMAAHLFVLYFGLMSMITPPVAIAAFTAAKLANAPPMSTGFVAVRFGWPAYVVPFLFVMAPNLIMQGSFIDICLAFLTAIGGIWLASAGLTGYLFSFLSWRLRVIYIVAGSGLLIPSQAFEMANMVQIVGAVIGGATLGWEYYNFSRAAKPRSIKLRGNFVD